MTSTIILYQGVAFTPSKNFAVEDLSTYLNGLGASRQIAFTQQNYVKHELSLMLPLKLPQADLNFNANNYNYCQITNYNNGVAEKTAYYFIRNRKQASKEVLRLELLMDTLNTIGYNLKLSSRTYIHRENKNRWTISTTYAYPVIDKVSEEFLPVLYKSSEKVLKTNTYNDFKWYLCYLTQSDIAPSEINQVTGVKTLILPEHDIDCFTCDGSFTLPMDSRYYTISPRFNETNGAGTIDGNTIAFEDVKDRNINSWNYSAYPTTKYVSYWVFIQASSGHHYIYPYSTLYDKDMNVLANIQGTPSDKGSVVFKNFCGTIKMHVGNASPLNENGTINYYQRPTTPVEITGIKTLDKTNQRIIKIVELPYCPIPIYEVYNNATYSFEMPVKDYVSSGISGNFIEVQGINLDTYKNEITINGAYFSDYTIYRSNLNLDFRKAQLKSGAYEPKLLNSELYLKKFVYDAFVYDWKYENIPLSSIFANINAKFKFKQVSSLAVTSKFLFDFTPSIVTSEPLQDYADIICISRNNEITIYNNQYINYLRSGLQYDLKQKELQNENNVRNAVFSGTGALVSLAVGVASMNPVGVALGAIGAGIAIGASIYNTMRADINAQNAIDNKKAQLAEQKASVAGADDLGLLRHYADDNFPKIVTYTPSSAMRTKLFNLFHYCGYKAEYMGVPATNSRLRFNYIMADIDLDETDNNFLTANYTEEIINNYKDKWAQGITIIHHFNNEWDFEQKYENWEAILESYLQ